MKTGAKVVIFSEVRKKVCNGFIEVCNRFTLFLKVQIKQPILHHTIHSCAERHSIKNEKMSKTKRVRISNESLNSYGTRVLTAGMNVEQYNRNPVLLYMHERGQVIGYVKDLKVEGDEVTGELMFDEATELSQRCKKQWEFGSLKMVSVGIDILELSEDPKHLVQGQTSPTISKSKLFEVSLVDIGANDDAIVLQKDGKRIELGKDGGVELPLLHSNNNKNQKPKQMDQEKLALELGLPKDADEATINAKLAKLKADGAEAETLRQERDALRAARIETLVNAAIAEKKIGEDKKQQFLDLGKKIGADELKQTFDAMSPQVKLSNIVGSHGGGAAGGSAEYKKLSDVPSDELAKLREQNPAQYKKLYKAEYGIECEI